jgi:hypothetical protein
MNKKFIASVLTISMLMGLSVPAMAGDTQQVTIDNSTLSFTVSGDSSVQIQEVKLDVPVDEGYVINPFKQAATLNDQTVSSQVIGAVHKVHNYGSIGVKIDVTALKATPNKGYVDKKGWPITIAGKSVANTKDWSKSKNAYLYLKFAEKEEDLEKSTSIAKAVLGVDKKGNEIADKKGGKKLNAMDVKAGGDYFYQLCGDVNANPKQLGGKADDHDMWTADDKITVSYKLVFTPQVNK